MPPKQGVRKDQKQIAGHFPREVRLALLRLGVDRDATIQVLLAEALNELFAKYGMARIADETPQPRGGAAHQRKRRNLEEDH